MRNYYKGIAVMFIVCCVVKSEVLTALWLLAAFAPIVGWFFNEAGKRI